MRDALGIEKPTDILDHIASLPKDKQQEAHDKIEAVERKAMAVQKPQPGLTELMAYLDKRGLQKGICTRNFNEPVAHLMRTFMPDTKFEPIITRAFQPPKPDPAGIKHIAEQWGVSAENLIMVGDSADDTQAGKRAGSTTVLLVSEANEHLMEHEYTDVYISRYVDDFSQLLIS
jgi:HAD superfamily hydrolase (TIGR01509 family)